MTIRSHDQFNTIIYGINDRYRSIQSERRIVFLNQKDMKIRALEPKQPVNLISHWEGKQHKADHFLAIAL